MISFDFNVPFIRWADTVWVPRGEFATRNRQIYDHELVYVLEGRGRIILNGVAHEAAPDSLFLISPRVWHSFEAQPEAQRLLGVHFDWEIRPDTARFQQFFAADAPVENSLFRPVREITHWNLAQQPFLDLKGRPRTRQLLESVLAEYARGDAESRENAGALLAASIGHIAREARLIRELTFNSTVSPDAMRRVQRARELLENSREAVLCVEDVARLVGWSGDHLRRMFRAVLNTSPAQVQTAARIRRAQELLRYGSIAIHEIARRCGFEDASHFSRVFKRETGHTPREWMNLKGARHKEKGERDSGS